MRIRSILDVLARFMPSTHGLAAVEAALFTPFMVMGTLAVVDMGISGAQKLDMEQSIRAGAQFSMVNITDVDEIISRTTISMGLEENGSYTQEGLCEINMTCITASFYCECDSGSRTDCQQLCPGTELPPSKFMTLTAAKQRNGILLPDGNIVSSITVQTR